MTDLFLAIDGGQSGTAAVLATADGTILGVGRGGPVRHHDDLDAEQFMKDGLTAAVTGAMNGAEDRDQVVMCCLAMTGSAGIAERVIRELVPSERYVVLGNDTFAALASGTAGGGGIGLIAGTGTVALALGRSGNHILVGGWGWLLGDEGGGFWIAIEALKAAARDVDGTGPHTVLTSELPRVLGQPDVREVYNLVTGQRLDRTAIAALSTSIVEIAAAGDEVAARILDRSADHLTELVVATIAAAPFLEPDEQVVVACGGVLSPGGFIVTRLIEQLSERASGFHVVVPTVPPVIGALYLAFRERGVEVDDLLRDRVVEQVRVRASLISKTPPPATALAPHD